MKRIRFGKKGNQRRFLDKVIDELGAVSLRGLLQFGFSVNYSTLKNYYGEARLIPFELFSDLCEVSGLDKEGFNFEVVSGNWGQVKGGRKSKRGKLKN